jgi:UPF0176 protein
MDSTTAPWMAAARAAGAATRDNRAMPLFHIAFYRFVPLADPDGTAAHLRALASAQALTGSVIVAHEGVNGTLAGPAEALDAFEAAMGAMPGFAGLAFRRTACVTPPFARLAVHWRRDIVAVGEGGGPPAGTAVDPAAWRALLDAPDVVVLDNRNRFEWRLGRFRGAIDPGVRHFRDFPDQVRAWAPRWRAEGRRVAMYCTGGIRCDKTSAWMVGLGLDVLRLDGGILRYFAEVPDAHADWDGACFVFDNRVALDTRLQETATTADEVFADPDDHWRLARARRLDAAV